jgi:hypothetical protein
MDRLFSQSHRPNPSFIIAARPIFANPRHAGASFANYRATRISYSAAKCFRSAIRA